MKRSIKLLSIIFGVISITCITSLGYADTVIRLITGSGGIPYQLGFFSSTGNAGLVDFTQAPTGYQGAEVIDNTLTGYFWMQTIGWNTFQNVVLEPNNIPGQSVIKLWTLSGAMWGDQAGWTYLNTSASGVTFDPVTTTFSGYAWNDGIGWVDMSALNININAGFIGKVKVIGNLGGNKSFDTLYSLGPTFQSAKIADIMNTIHKNISLIMRNISSNSINTDFTTTSPKIFDKEIIFQNTTPGAINHLTYSNNAVNNGNWIQSKIENSSTPVRSVIVIGADIYIDTSVSPYTGAPPLAFIALADSSGNGGNIYIDGSVKTIQASLIAEKSVQSATFLGNNVTPYILNLNKDSVAYLPLNQLYVNGSIISFNTIGGSIQNQFVCPFFQVVCDENSSLRYDFNYFRNYDQTALRQAIPGYNNYSMVINYDNRIQSDPPPGLANVNY